MWRNNDDAHVPVCRPWVKSMTPASAPNPEHGAVVLAFTSKDTVAFLKGSIKLCSRELCIEASGRLVVQAACRGGGWAGLACWPKKGLLCCVVEHGRPGGTGRGRKNAQIEFRFKHRLPPFCGLTQRPPFPPPPPAQSL